MEVTTPTALPKREQCHPILLAMHRVREAPGALDHQAPRASLQKRIHQRLDQRNKVTIDRKYFTIDVLNSAFFKA
jgi:hypothetical protein